MTTMEMEQWGHDLMQWQRVINWALGDLARAARAKLGDDNYSQVFPEDASPGAIQRWEAVARAYPREEDRNPLASWTIHMREANRADRIQRVQDHVDKGRTSDEAQRAAQNSTTEPSRWLLAVDVHYYLHRWWFSGAGVEAAVGVANWVQRTVERLRQKGLTDVVCCFDSPTNDRKKLTENWDDKYKDRPPKDPELRQQLQLVRELLQGHGFACVSVDGWEADDCMASYAKAFPAHVTLLSQDKDVRQCLSNRCNILLDVEWIEDETTGEQIPEYKWLSRQQHVDDTGIDPTQWPDYQAIMGDSVDGIKGAAGIGEKGAADLIREFGSAEAAIAAAKEDDERIPPRKRKSLIEFEAKLEVTKQLVTLRDGLEVPRNTRI